jgi:hypothetical protein
MDQLFEFAAGSVAGRGHRLAGRNNQDAYCCLNDQGYTVAVVCDGCGSGVQSEVGAQLGARLVAHALLRRAPRLKCQKPSCAESLLEQVRKVVLARLMVLSEAVGEEPSQFIGSHFLFTVVGALFTPTVAMFFSLGDGVLVIDGEEIPLGPFADNAPPYLAYGLVETTLEWANPELLRFQVHRVVPLDELRSFLLGTDGVLDLKKCAARNVPGKDEIVGPLSQFWREDRFFNNPDMTRRRLAGINRDALVRTGESPRCEIGLLQDDTTLIVGRRRAVEAIR